MKNTVGQRVKILREALNLNQRDFAAPLTIGQSGISQIEQGVHLPGLETIIEIAVAYGASLDWLLLDIGAMLRPDKFSDHSSSPLENKIKALKKYVDSLDQKEPVKHKK